MWFVDRLALDVEEVVGPRTRGEGGRWVRVLGRLDRRGGASPGAGPQGRELILFNHLGGVRWEEQPLGLHDCQQCARSECSERAWARVSRTATHVLLVAPGVGRRAADAALRAPRWLGDLGAVGVDFDRWNELQLGAAELDCAVPAETVLPAAGRMDLWEAWVAGLPPLLGRAGPALFPTLLRRFLGAEGMRGQGAALESIDQACGWLQRARGDALFGGLVPAEDLGAELPPLVLDAERSLTWRPLGIAPGGAVFLALGGDRLYLTEEPVLAAA